MKNYEWMLLLVSVVIWVWMLTIFKRKKMTAFYFMAGIAGLFSFIFLIGKTQISVACSKLLMSALGMLNLVFSWYEVYPEYNILFVNNEKAAISLFVDYECCGVIEMLVVFCVVVFFSALSKREKVVFSLLGLLYTAFSNVIRLLVVTSIIAHNGNDWYFKAHSIYGRIVFYVLTLIMYFYLLTYPQIKKQKVGNFNYE